MVRAVRPRARLLYARKNHKCVRAKTLKRNPYAQASNGDQTSVGDVELERGGGSATVERNASEHVSTRDVLEQAHQESVECNAFVDCGGESARIDEIRILESIHRSDERIETWIIGA